MTDQQTSDPLRPVGYRVPESLIKEINAAAKDLHISGNAVVIHGLKAGIEQVRKALQQPEVPAEQ
jgi:hypothetical protein